MTVANVKKRNIVYRFFRRARKEALLLLLPEIAGSIARLNAIEIAYRAESGGEPVVSMNSQDKRKEIVTSVIGKMGVQLVIETGTYLAGSTLWLAQFGAPVYTSEISSPIYYMAKKNVAQAGATNVNAINCDSRELIRKVIADGLGTKQTFIYLDAHWLKDLPLLEEIISIDEGFKDYIILIDDFRVPGDDGYGFDIYSIGKRLDYHYIQQTVKSRGISVYFPTVPSTQETGARRGYVFLTKSAKNDKILSETANLVRYG